MTMTKMEMMMDRKDPVLEMGLIKVIILLLVRVDNRPKRTKVQKMATDKILTETNLNQTPLVEVEVVERANRARTNAKTG